MVFRGVEVEAYAVILEQGCPDLCVCVAAGFVLIVLHFLNRLILNNWSCRLLQSWMKICSNIGPLSTRLGTPDLEWSAWQNNQEFLRTYRDRGILVQLVFSSYTKACVVAASRPGQVYCRLQLVVHLLVDGASKFCTIITENNTLSWLTLIIVMIIIIIFTSSEECFSSTLYLTYSTAQIYFVLIILNEYLF